MILQISEFFIYFISFVCVLKSDLQSYSFPRNTLNTSPTVDIESDEEFLAYIKNKEPSYQASSPDEVSLLICSSLFILLRSL